MTAQLVSQPACLPEAIERIRRQFDPLRIILFGSWARGQACPDSDLDLLVVLPHVEDKRRATLEIMRALAGLPISKDIVVTTPAEIAARGNAVGHVLRPALREAKCSMNAPESNALEAARWLAYARSDLNAARALQTAEAVYQAIEQDIK